jgi:hypothetical protein
VIHLTLVHDLTEVVDVTAIEAAVEPGAAMTTPLGWLDTIARRCSGSEHVDGSEVPPRPVSGILTCAEHVASLAR